MRVDRLRATHYCRVLTQMTTGCFPSCTLFLFSGFHFSTLRPVRRLELSPSSIYGGLSALARGCVHGVTLFQTLAGLLGIFFYFLCFTPLSSNRGTSASRAAQGFVALSA